MILRERVALSGISQMRTCAKCGALMTSEFIPKQGISQEETLAVLESAYPQMKNLCGMDSCLKSGT